MRMLSYVFETSLSFSEPVSEHSFVLRCLPKQTNTQKVLESQVFTDPRIPLFEGVDGFGNRVVVGYCPKEHDSFKFYASGLVVAEPEGVGDTPMHAMYLPFTPLTLADGALSEAASEQLDSYLEEALADDAPGEGVSALSSDQIWALAQRMSSFVHDHFTYVQGVTDTHTTAAEAFEGAKGVCQDYSHCLISMCRAIGIPARYVTGLMQGEGESHAWVEIHDGHRWLGLDPTNNKVVDDHYLLFCTGRDFEDCPIERGVFRGNALQLQKVFASVGDNPAHV